MSARIIPTLRLLAAELVLAAGSSLLGAPVLQAQELNWATSAGGDTADGGIGVAMDGAGNVHVAGIFSGTATFGAGEANETQLTAEGEQDVFVAKYDQSGRLLWATRAGGNSEQDTDRGAGIAMDGRGDSYVTGSFQGTATFGAGEANETQLTAEGEQDVFVAKYDQSGRLLWATKAGGGNADSGLGIATDGPGNSYVTGVFRGSATFGAGEVNETILTAAGVSDVFVAKYDQDGGLLWATRAGGTGQVVGQEIAIDSHGISYVTGGFDGTATFGASEVNETELTALNEPFQGFDVFVAKYDQNGRLLWATRAGGTRADESTGIATDGRGNSYVTGNFGSTATFGAGEANETVLTAAGGFFDFDVFVAKYDQSGRLLWATRAGGTGFDSRGGIASDPRGNSYVTGSFEGTATFGAGEANETQLAAAGGGLFAFDIFMAKYDRSGRLLWATRAGGDDSDGGSGIAADRRGNSYVTGHFRGTATFGAGEVNETQLTTEAGDPDIFVAKYSTLRAAEGF